MNKKTSTAKTTETKVAEAKASEPKAQEQENSAIPTHTVNTSLKPEYKRKRGIHFGKVSPLKVAFAFRHLGIMLKSGLALEGAITILSQQLDDERLKSAFAEMLVDIGGGTSIADSMRNHPDVFSNLVISLISAGEQGGTLNDNLFILADYLKKEHELQQKVKGAMVYPLIVLGMTSFEILGVVYFLLPRLDSMFSAFGNIPEFTKVVLNGAAFIRDNTIAILFLLVFGGVMFQLFLKKTKAGKRFKDTMALSFPVFKNLNKNNILATFSQTFSILLNNAIPINDALKIASETNDNIIYIDALRKINDQMMAGQSLSAAMLAYPKLFPFTYVKMVEIGEQTSSLAETLKYVHEFYAEEAAEISNNLATLLEPILLIFIGVMIGGLAMIIIGPIYQLMSTLN